MERTQTLFLLFISGFCSFALGSSDFHLSENSVTYEEAKAFCREMYTDLATIHNATDMNNLITLVGNKFPRAWIGLEAADVRMWHWTWPDKGVDFLNWNTGQPLNKSEDACAAMDENGRWFESECGVKRSFVCQSNIFVAETKSWRNAQNHCRGLSSDLVSVLSLAQNEAVRNLSGSQTVWIGLFKDPWKWSDGSNSSFRFWKPSQPNYLNGQDCTAAIFKDEGEWNDLRCTTKRHFVCRGAVKSIPATTSQSSTQPATPDQLTTNMTTPLSTPSPSNATNVPTTEATTASELTTLNTTVSSTSSTDLDNATTLMSNVTTTQLTPTTAVQVTTDGDSALTTLNTTLSNTSSTEVDNATTLMSNVTTTQLTLTTAVQVTTDGDSALTTLNTTVSNTSSIELNNATTETSNVTTQLIPTTAVQVTDSVSTLTTLNTTQNTTLQPTDSSLRLTPGKLTLIKKNMTWIEAMSYCRKHHIDLVHITTRDVQERVAEKARNATSPHVWLGLRYTCSFNFWFWISSGSNCYLNWAPGHGPEGENECGATGAIEATGGQQWVGLPETEKLNFICSSCAG